MKKLAVLRKQLDTIDRKLIVLIGQRMKIARKIGVLKMMFNLPIYQPRREKEILKHVASRAKRAGIEPSVAVHLFQLLFRASRKAQHGTKKQ
ncbi:MAG TPA: chorismate mutase [Candidatus Paceibacterota bacterium]